MIDVKMNCGVFSGEGARAQGGGAQAPRVWGQRETGDGAGRASDHRETGESSSDPGTQSANKADTRREVNITLSRSSS